MPVTKHSLPNAPEEGEIMNKWGQNKRNIWNLRRSYKEELQQCNRLGTASIYINKKKKKLCFRGIPPVPVLFLKRFSVVCIFVVL